jgi:hypothetical protein
MDAQTPISWVQQAASAIESLPGGASAPAVAGLITGMVLLLVGGKILKPAAVIISGALGALSGSLLMPGLVSADIGSVSPAYVGLALGGVAGMAVAALLFRFAMAAAGAATFSVLGVLGAAVYLAFAAGATPESARESLAEMGRRQGTVLLASLPNGATRDDAGGPGLARNMLSDASAQAGAAWEGLAPEHRLTLAGTAFICGLIGLILGALMPRRAAAMLTALLGAGVALASLAWLAQALDLPGRGLIHQGPLAWLMTWLCVAVTGIALQLHGQAEARAARK